MKVVEFYNTGICESEPKTICKLSDKDWLQHTFANELHNLDESECLEVRIKEISAAECGKVWRAYIRRA